MPVTIRRSRPEDRAAILALMDRTRGDDLDEAQRAERGFVQGNMTGETLARLEQGTGIFIAEQDGELAGFAMTCESAAVTGHLGGLTVRAARAVTGGGARLFLYGPVAVERRFQGRGVMRTLIAALSRELQDRYDLGVLFVELANRKSMAVHRHYGMTEVARFQNDGREYAVFTFDPGSFAPREP